MSNSVFRLISVVFVFLVGVAISWITGASLVTTLAVAGFIYAVDVRSDIAFTQLALEQMRAKEKKDEP